MPKPEAGERDNINKLSVKYKIMEPVPGKGRKDYQFTEAFRDHCTKSFEEQIKQRMVLRLRDFAAELESEKVQ